LEIDEEEYYTYSIDSEEEEDEEGTSSNLIQTHAHRQQIDDQIHFENPKGI
jgi:hypothetical protein